MAQMLPLLMMRHRRIPRAKWKDCTNPQGKRWIEQVGPQSETAVRIGTLCLPLIVFLCRRLTTR